MPAQIVIPSALPPALPELPGGPRHDWSQLLATLSSAGPLTWCRVPKEEVPGKDDRAKRRNVSKAILKKKLGRVQTSLLGAHVYFRLIPASESK